ncbi:restriction endonuclease subunit S [Priestia koreensis]|uniref:restriction endonuclease subunit S n=1 Tax=Priestia koreensis TaxID=284581 RepID=UPI001F566877|nr:restriction endonuclease subunit S [Priestia koreensis]UNL85270.1 restriction endonuclease subunit S [Priestia koreensis]
MSEMIDTNIQWLGEIPLSWELKKIKYVLRERIEKNNPIRTSFILSLTAKQGVIPYDEKEGGGNKPKEDVSAYRLAYPGDIVMNSMNILSGSVGLSKYFGCVSPVYYMLRPFATEDDVRYYNYIFQSTLFQKSLFGLGNGILIKESGNGKLNTIRMRIPMDKFGGLYIPIAPKDDQKKIADFLDEKCNDINTLLSDIQKQIDVLESYKRSVISEAITKGLNQDVVLKDSGIFYIGPINSKWEISKIGYICTKLSRSFEPSDTALVCSNKGKVMVRNENIIGKMVSGDNAMQGIHKGDIAIHGMDTWHGAIALSEYDGKITRVVHVCDSTEDKRLVVYFMQYLAFQGVYKLISNGVRGNTSDFRSWDKVKDIYIPLPTSLDEQKEICDFLDDICLEVERIIEKKKEQLSVLEDYKKATIYEYVTGKKEVPVSE